MINLRDGSALALAASAARSAMHSDTDVVIVGAGPVGLTLALLLARRGRTVAVYERWASAYPLPRAAAMSHETLRTFQSAGVLERLRPHLNLELKEQSAPCYAPDGEVLMTMHFPGVGESGYPPMTGFHQPDVDRQLGEACEAEPLIALHRGWDAKALEQNGDHVIVSFDPFEGEPPDQAPQRDGVTARSRFVIGCDGASSTVRTLMNTTLNDTGFSSRWLVVDTVPTSGFSIRVPFGTVMNPARPTLLAPAGIGRQRFEFMVVEGDDPERIADEGSVMRLLEPWGVTADNTVIHRRAIYTFRGRWAENWRDGHVLLAGDAAHQMPPFLGQGLNSGVRDAIALAWRLDLILSGKVPLGVLDSYTSERLHHVKEITDSSVAIGQMMCMTDPAEVEERNGVLRMMRDDPTLAPPQPVWRLGPGCFMPDDPAAGFLAQQARVEKDGQIGLLDDLIGAGHFVLMGNDVDPLANISEEARLVFEALGGRGINMGARGYVDVDGSYTAWFEKLGASVVLARPDFQIFGASARADDANGMILKLSELLGMRVHR